MSKFRLELLQYREGILRQDRGVLSQAITLVESSLREDRIMAGELVESLLPNTGQSIRIGITGAPGVGKSSFIEVFGSHLTRLPKKVAVLTIDPGSRRGKGSILGDKTRMHLLSQNPNAFIRPTSAGYSPGGIHSKTREAILLCEAAGFDVVIVETVGAGQLEVDAYELVDFFLLLMLGGAGDGLQGIKRGIMELVDSIVITQADGEGMQRAQASKLHYETALSLFPASKSTWTPRVLLTSALDGSGIEDVWQTIDQFQKTATENGRLQARREDQLKAWLQTAVNDTIKLVISQQHELQKQLDKLEKDIISRKKTVPKAIAEVTEYLERVLKERR